ncbi:MAG: recombinase family protein [Negativicutes bacterium]|nr:recombinase family protein [Negativicutes bacterium]
MQFGYIRISSKDQNEGRQYDKMKALGIEDRFLFIDKQSGKDFNRPEYQTMRRMLRKGDLVFIDSLDRLGRTYEGVIQEWRHITRDIEADIVVLDNEALFDSRKFREMGDIGRLMEDQFLSLLAYIGAEERLRILQRQREGIQRSLALGLPYGRRKVGLTDRQKEIIHSWQDGKFTAVAAAREAGLSRRTFYRKAKELAES